MAGYLSFAGLANAAQNPEVFTVFLAIVFLVVTILLRWIGTQDPDAAIPAKSSQWLAVVTSAVCFVSLVYASGGQIWLHAPFDNQKLYGQVVTAALGIVWPPVYRRFFPHD
jgi:hypothetical protein